jgi:transposase
LLKLYLYGYLNRVRASRQLEREAHRNAEVMWLLRRLAPDFKTIADFRRDNRKAIRNVSREFTLFCRQLDLFSGDLVAIDGSKFKAVNRRDRNFTRKQLKRVIQKLDEDIDRYLDEMDQADEEEPEEKKLTAEELQEKIEEMKCRRAEAEKMERKLDESGESQISLTDPDSRMMPVSGGRRNDVAYNVQFSVDPKHKLIVDHKLTITVTDRDLLSDIAKRANCACKHSTFHTVW